MTEDFMSSEDLVKHLADLVSNLELSCPIPRGAPSAYQKQLLDYAYDIVERLRTGDYPRELPSE